MDAQQAKFLVQFMTQLWEGEFPATCKVLAAVPEARRDCKPDDKSRSAWDLTVHLAMSDIWFLDAIRTGSFGMRNRGREEVRGRASDGRRCRAVIRAGSFQQSSTRCGRCRMQTCCAWWTSSGCSSGLRCRPSVLATITRSITAASWPRTCAPWAARCQPSTGEAPTFRCRDRIHPCIEPSPSASSPHSAP